MAKKYSDEEISEITGSYSVLDYFNLLASKNKVIYDRKSGREHYYRTDQNKFAVNESKYYDFKTGEGGGIVKAVMFFENKNWKEAMDFIKNNSGFILNDETFAVHQSNKKNSHLHYPPRVLQIHPPNNDVLFNYFEKRGITRDILENHTSQIHFEVGGKCYFGIGIENQSGGYEVRNPFLKTKIGNSNFSSIPGTKSDEIVVFEGLTDMLSFLRLQKDSKITNTRTLIALNSVMNAEKFIDFHKDYTGKIFLCLDNDRAGSVATEKIIKLMPNAKTKDIRNLYGIQENGFSDLNDYLVNKLFYQQKNDKLGLQNFVQNGSVNSQSDSISKTVRLQSGSTGFNSGKSGENSEPEKGTDIRNGQNSRGTDAGNGLTDAVRGNSGKQYGMGASASGKQPADVRKNSAQRGAVAGQLSGIANRFQKTNTGKISNEEITKLAAQYTFIKDDKVFIKQDLEITDDVKATLKQFKAGGTEKLGRGILDEYYTDQKIVSAFGSLLNDYFKQKVDLSILEPSVGTGNFLPLARNLSQNSHINSFEINATAARIAKILHPEANINLRSFETEFITEKGEKIDSENFSEKYDLVLGNPPYGEHRGIYKGLGEEQKITKYEDYFVKRSLDSLKTDGILAMVLPSSWIGRQKKIHGAELHKAYRLPSGVFGGTKVGTDMVILKKSADKIPRDFSDYFNRNPAHILGNIKERTNRFGRQELYVSGSLDEALIILNQLQNQKQQVRVGNLFEDYSDEITLVRIESESSTTQNLTDAEGKNAVDPEWEKQLSEATNKIQDVLQSLEAIKFKSALISKEIENFSQLRRNLSETPENITSDQLKDIIFKSDLILQSGKEKNGEYLVQKSPEIKKGILKYQFSKGDEIVNTSLQNSAKISPEQLAAFTDTAYDGTVNNLDKNKPFANYFDGKWIHDFYYAEGNIYAKLEQLERDFANKSAVDGTDKQYEKQKALLQSVLPRPKALDEIIISPNHEFVHQFSMGVVEKERWNPNTRKNEIVSQNASLADTFKTFVGTLPGSAFAGSSSWEVRSFVDNENVTGSDKERNALIRERRKEAANDLFNKYIREELSDIDRNRFVAEFNRKFNNIHVPDYSQFPLFSKINRNFKGSPLALTEVQRAGVGRLTTKGVGLLAHEVGFGKTLSGIISMHEAMHRGNAKRPLIVVPNSNILKQWVETIFETIPDAKINILGNLGKDYDLSKFDNKDGEITLVTYEGFNNIGFSKSITENLASKFSYISENELKAVKNSERDIQIGLQKEKEVEGKMKRGKIYDWEDFGFDHITFDEVHNANHIVGKVRIEDRRFSSDFRSQNQRTSGLGINAWMACQYIQEKNNGRNVTLLSATPFTNKPLEYYSILSLIANKRLEESGYFNVNNFFETFMEADNEMEIGATGDVKFKSNVRRFKNNSLFQQLLSEFIDLKGEEDNPELKRPNRINKEYKIEQNDFTKTQYEYLNESFSEEEPGAILTHILNARLIAISPYLSVNYNGETPGFKEFVENSPKLKLTMDLIARNKADIPDAGQIIYSELAVSEFPKLKEYLVKEVGFKPNEVGIITGATTKNQRIDIQNDFNSGKIKVIIGSEAIQEGMNLQERTSDMYLLSLPYNFTSLRQVEGRAWRQGNHFENVRINYMLTNDSIDVFMLQKLQAKQARYLEAMKKGANVVDVSDVNTQELKTAIITNPETRANIEIELLKRKLQNEKDRYLADQSFVLRKFEDYTKVMDKVTVATESLKRVQKWAQEAGDESTWNRHLVNYEANVNRAKFELKETIEYLATKGVNVAEIERQNQLTAEKIAEYEKKIEKLPELHSALVRRYTKENDDRIAKVSAVDNVAERKNENAVLFLSKNNDENKNNSKLKR